MSLRTRIESFATQVATDMKQHRVWLTGTSSGTFTLTTTAQNVRGAIDELKASSSGAPAASTEAVAGVIEVATQAEMTTGTADNLAVTPLKHKVDGDARWQAKSVNLANLAGFTTSTAQALGTSDTVLPTQAAVKAYADGLLDANNAYQYKGGLDASANPNYPAASAGHTYKITVAGRIGGASGPVVEVNDSVTCLVDATAAGNHATVGANWLITQTNIDGAVIGPATSVAGSLPTFSGTTGKVIQDSGVSIDTDTTLGTNTNGRIATVLAIRTFLSNTFYTKTEIGDPENDILAVYNAAKA